MARPPGWIPRPLGAPQNTPRPVCPISPPGPRCPRPHAAVRHGGGGTLFWGCLTYSRKIRGLAGIFSYLEWCRNPPQFVPGAKASHENHMGARPRSCTGPRYVLSPIVPNNTERPQAARLAPNGLGVAIGPKGRNPTPDRYTKRKRAGRNSARMGAYDLLDLGPL